MFGFEVLGPRGHEHSRPITLAFFSSMQARTCQGYAGLTTTRSRLKAATVSGWAHRWRRGRARGPGLGRRSAPAPWLVWALGARGRGRRKRRFQGNLHGLWYVGKPSSGRACGPAWERSSAFELGGKEGRSTRSRECAVIVRDAWYCQPCGQSPAPGAITCRAGSVEERAPCGASAPA